MELTNQQRAVLEQAANNLEAGILQLDSVIADTRNKLAEFEESRDRALANLLEFRAKAGLTQSVQ